MLRKSFGTKDKWRRFMMITTELDLEVGELICNLCDGGGSYPQKFLELEDPKYNRCPKCKGNGKVDWVMNIMWKGHREGIKYGTIRLPLMLREYPKLEAKDLFIEEETKGWKANG
jgi:hypothetical protein